MTIVVPERIFVVPYCGSNCPVACSFVAVVNDYRNTLANFKLRLIFVVVAGVRFCDFQQCSDWNI